MTDAKTPMACRYKNSFGWKPLDEKQPAECCADAAFSADTVSAIENNIEELQRELDKRKAGHVELPLHYDGIMDDYYRTIIKATVLALILAACMTFTIYWLHDNCYLHEYALGEMRCGDQKWSWEK